MANAENKLKGNYYVAWLSRCDSAWRRLLADRGPYVSQYQLKKEHHDACQTIAKDLLWSQFNDWKRGKKYGPKANPRRVMNMSRPKGFPRQIVEYYVQYEDGSRKKITKKAALATLGRKGLGDLTHQAFTLTRATKWRPGRQTILAVWTGQKNPRRYRRNRLFGPYSKKGRAAARRYKSQVRKSRLTILRRAKAGGWDGYGKIRRFRTGRPGVHEYVRPQAWMKSNPSSDAHNKRVWKDTLKALDAAYWAVTKGASPKAQKAAMTRLAKKAKRYGIHVPRAR